MYQPFKYAAKLLQLFQTFQHFCIKNAEILTDKSLLLIFLI